MKRIFLLGSLNCDFTIRAPYLPEAGETLKGSDFLLNAGGKGANQAYACGVLGGPVSMAGAVGKDMFGDMLLESLNGAGVDTRHIRRAERNTGVAVITVIGGDNRIILDEGANGAVEGKDVDLLLAEAKEGDLFVTQLENPLPVIVYALRRAKERGLFTVFNPAPAVPEAAEAVRYADLITPNKKELRLLSGEGNIEMGCEKLLQMGAGAVLVTLGEKGSKYVSRGQSFDVPCITVGEAVDTTAAGDTFCGALCVKMAEGAPVGDAARFAALCAGIAVTRRGAQISVPTRSEAEQILRNL